MLFTSPEFAILFALTFALYYMPPLRRVQVPLLIVASLVFYAWSQPALLVLLLISIAINSVTSYRVAFEPQLGRRKQWATAGVVVNLAVLALFKYGGLLTSVVVDPATTGQDTFAYMLLHLPLPIGISFYTFEGISLLLDVFRGRERENGRVAYVSQNFAEHAANTTLFVAFFPHLIAGPILKAKSFYPQIAPKALRDIPWERAFNTLIVGYFLKMVVADNLHDYTFWIAYPYYQAQGTITNMVLLFGYAMQIFADFAGYSLIALGLAALLGYDLIDNFNFPYISRSLAEFWRRWHISLSTWLRDYLYFSLGGNRKGRARTYLNLLIVMTLGGIWHGAAWSYAVWGLFHGLGLAVERALGMDRERDPQVRWPLWRSFLVDSVRVALVFTFVSLGWVLFKLPDFSQALGFLGSLATNTAIRPNINLILPVLVLSLPVLLYHLPHFPTIREWRERQTAPTFAPALLRQALMSAMLVLIVLNSGTSEAFIYFQF